MANTGNTQAQSKHLNQSKYQNEPRLLHRCSDNLGVGNKTFLNNVFIMYLQVLLPADMRLCIFRQGYERGQDRNLPQGE